MSTVGAQASVLFCQLAEHAEVPGRDGGRATEGGSSDVGLAANAMIQWARLRGFCVASRGVDGGDDDLAGLRRPSSCPAPRRPRACPSALLPASALAERRLAPYRLPRPSRRGCWRQRRSWIGAVFWAAFRCSLVSMAQGLNDSPGAGCGPPFAEGRPRAFRLLEAGGARLSDDLALAQVRSASQFERHSPRRWKEL